MLRRKTADVTPSAAIFRRGEYGFTRRTTSARVPAMTRVFVLILLTACTDTHYGAALNLSPDGVSIAPSVSGRYGRAHFTISP